MIRVATDLGPRRARFLDHQALALVLVVASEVYAEHGHEAEITGGTEPGHRTMMHPTGRALDFRVVSAPQEKWKLIRDEIAERLGPDFDVLLELRPPHIHVEHDPKP